MAAPATSNKWGQLLIIDTYHHPVSPPPLSRRICALLLLLAFLPGHAPGCLALAESGLIGVNHEDVVIIWDHARHTEHFIRSVTLNSSAKDAGFLVPTPTTPQLAVADMRIFDVMEWYLPKPKEGLNSTNEAIPAARTDGTGPRIISEQDIGDYHAVVLAASDAKGLGDWLKANGYPWTDSSAKWLQPYLAAKWKITAFKFRRGDPANVSVLHTSAIRMSFTTARPFFPYREPAEAAKLSGTDRVLRIAFLGDHRVIGRLDDGAAWPAHLDIAGSTTPPYAGLDPNDWLKYAGLSGLHLPPRLTYFSDYSNPRPGRSDLFFSAGPDQSNSP